jgi:hypothetical protein
MKNENIQWSLPHTVVQKVLEDGRSGRGSVVIFREVNATPSDEEVAGIWNIRLEALNSLAPLSEIQLNVIAEEGPANLVQLNIPPIPESGLEALRALYLDLFKAIMALGIPPLAYEELRLRRLKAEALKNT